MTSVVIPARCDNAAASPPNVTFLDVTDDNGRLLLRTFNTAEAAAYKHAWDSVQAPGVNRCRIEQRSATLPARA
ncbi:hypothetical protein ETAA8_28520 [Anatilimnocola aggregata]|uniref:Uncharacterized protein n=1 Tax=Anatilimnocola aggregata TaxID=2528021 RepID=A0A517YCA0_9BACT|nr:hypothetical protein [Anatilimnocola aggregata]QDU27762.1 hypothetical protein ETAA8_28520 [Anatilimnocola aggregata]